MIDPDIFQNFALGTGVILISFVTGYPLSRTVIQNVSWPGKLVISFSLGIIILSVAGICGGYICHNPLFVQGIVLLGSILCIGYKPPCLIIPDNKYDIAALGLCFLYIFITIIILTINGLWREGDPAEHASVIRLILNTGYVPVSIPPLGTAWEYYPKAFHYFAAFFCQLFPIEGVIQVIPAIITGMAPLGLYCIVKEYTGDLTGLFTCAAALFCFPAHYATLIWGGYPTATAELLLITFIYLAIIHSSLAYPVLGGVLIAHTRLIGFAIPVAVLYHIADTILKKMEPYYCAVIIGGILAVFGICSATGYLLRDSLYLIPVLSIQAEAAQFAIQWVFAILAIFGMASGFFQQFRLWLLGMVWIITIGVFFILADLQIVNLLQTAPDRIFVQMYIPMSIFTGLALSSLSTPMNRCRITLLIIQVSIGIVMMLAVFHGYHAGWAMQDEDHAAISWLGDHANNSSICLNPDGSGAWVYPLTNIPVSVSALIPPGTMDTGTDWYDLTVMLAKDPNNPELIDHLRQKDQPVIVFTSTITNQGKERSTPFRRYYHLPVTKLNTSFSDQYYSKIYDHGAILYNFIG